PKESIARCAVAVEGNGTVWTIYSALRRGRHGIFVRPVRAGKGPGAEVELVRGGAGQEINPVACTDHGGAVRILYQTWPTVVRPGNPALRLHLRKVVLRDGKLEPRGTAIGADGNLWSPALAAGPGGMVARAHDSYRGDSDVMLLVDGHPKGVQA